MKVALAASLVALTLFSGSAFAGSSPYGPLRDTAPRSVFDDSRDSAPRSVAVLGDTESAIVTP